MKACPREVHEHMKADPVVWDGLKFVGYQEGARGKLFELRNCRCTSTISKPVVARLARRRRAA